MLNIWNYTCNDFFTKQMNENTCPRSFLKLQINDSNIQPMCLYLRDFAYMAWSIGRKFFKYKANGAFGLVASTYVAWPIR